MMAEDDRQKMIVKVLKMLAFARDRLKETFNVPGSENFRRWQSGEFVFAMASLRRPA